MERASHGFPPLVRPDSVLLVLGSFPSVTSREAAFFYMHPQNRFWRILSDVFGEDFAKADVAERTALLEKRKIALYDVVESCTIEGSGDASIRDVVPSDLAGIVSCAPIGKILVNGAKAWTLFQRHHAAYLPIAVPLPSTSPANAAMTYETLLGRWKRALLDD